MFAGQQRFGCWAGHGRVVGGRYPCGNLGRCDDVPLGGRTAEGGISNGDGLKGGRPLVPGHHYLYHGEVACLGSVGSG